MPSEENEAVVLRQANVTNGRSGISPGILRLGFPCICVRDGGHFLHGMTTTNAHAPPTRLCKFCGVLKIHVKRPSTQYVAYVAMLDLFSSQWVVSGVDERRSMEKQCCVSN